MKKKKPVIPNPYFGSLLIQAPYHKVNLTKYAGMFYSLWYYACTSIFCCGGMKRCDFPVIVIFSNLDRKIVCLLVDFAFAVTIPVR